MEQTHRFPQLYGEAKTRQDVALAMYHMTFFQLAESLRELAESGFREYTGMGSYNQEPGEVGLGTREVLRFQAEHPYFDP